MLSAIFFFSLIATILSAPTPQFSRTPSDVQMASSGRVTFRLKHPDLNLYWGTQNYSNTVWGLSASQIKLYSSDISTFRASYVDNTYQPLAGWYAFKNYDGTFLRQNGFNLWETPIGSGADFEYAFRLRDRGFGTVQVCNPYDSGVVAGYDSNSDRVVLVNPYDFRAVDWILEIMPQDKILHKIKQGAGFQILHPVTGRAWGSVATGDVVWGRPATQLKTGGNNPTTFVLSPSDNTYNNANGWGALKNVDTGTLVRHAGWVMWEMTPGTGPNYDFSYKIQPAGDGLYRIVNPYNNNVVVGYDSAADRVQIVNPKDPKVSAWNLVLV